MDIKQIKQLVKLVEESDIESLRIHEDNQEIEITKAGKTVVAAPAAQSIQVATQQVPTEIPATPASAAPAPSPVTENDNLVAIKSPMVGTFYSAPSPEDPPFVKVGDSIEKGKTVCIVEAMKLFNEIEAEVSGKIEKVCVSAGEAVEYGQTLFLVAIA